MKKSDVQINNEKKTISSLCKSDSNSQILIHTHEMIPCEHLISKSKSSEEGKLSQERIDKLEFVKERHKEALKLLSL